jgi:hypothetical protein
MRHSKKSLTLGFWLVMVGCSSVDTTPPEPVGDVGDTSSDALKVACNLSRADILASTQGGRRTAIERGFGWYDAQVPYSQSSNYAGYRTDCSGFVSMCWELGQSYTTANFINDTGEWTSLASFDELLPADAMVYRKNGAGHIVMFLGWNDASKTEACVLEQASTAEDMQFRARTTDSLQNTGYHAIRATKFGSDPGSGTGQCYCDAECSQYGDCCANCSSGAGGSSGSGSGGASGSGGSGSGSGQCYCDAECSQYGDCCANCGSGGSSGSGSGGASGSGSGGSGGQCYCDAECAQYGDCCANCGSGGSSGSGAGGSGGGQCYCDAECAQYGDCCANCGSGGSSGSGAGGSGGQCYCDAECAYYGDCCSYC